MDNVNPASRQTAPQSGGPRKRKKKKFSVGRLIGRIFLTIFSLILIGALSAGLFTKFFMTYINNVLVPSIPEVSIEELTMQLASTIYYQNKDGEWVAMDTLHNTGANRELIEFEDLPKHLLDALVAIEDQRFWEHKGVDWKGTIRATIFSASGSKTQGGSTITQQLIRQITEDNEVTVLRKFREIIRALEFEKHTDKEDIITAYLNQVYFGSDSYGIQKAAQTYFGKDASELDLAESACIVGITNNPSLYDPFRKAEFKQSDGTIKTPRDFNKKRQELILDEMLRQGKISQAECDAAKAEKLLFTDTPEYEALHANDPKEELETGEYNTWFVDAVINEARDLIMETKGVSSDSAIQLLFSAGYHIYTTLDPDIQKVVDSVYTDPANFNYPSPTGKPLNSAITVLDPYTGDVVAMAGGVGEKTTNRGQNLATIPRTPGSSIKPVSIYAPAIDYNLVSPGTVLDDYPLQLNNSQTGGFPKNSPNKYRGNVTVWTGLQYSINTIASRIFNLLGADTSYHFMNDKLGFHLVEADKALSPLSMGGLTYGVTTEEMAAAYGAFVNHGVYNKPRTVTRIESNDHSEVIVDNPSKSQIAMKETTAYLMNKMLRNAVTSGTGGGASFSGMTIAGKTGTTDNNFDRYFAGYTPYYTAAVWVGYSDAPERIKADVNPAAKIWKMVMEPIHANLENKSFFEKPDGIISVEVCADCGLKPGPLCSQDYRGSRIITMEIQAEAAPTETCTCHTEVRVCTDPTTGTMHLAGEFCPDSTVTTKVMLSGRQFLEVPYASPQVNADGSITTGWPILAEDSDAHATYLQLQGPCPIHDENFEEEPLLPGDPGFEWPDINWPDIDWPWENDDDEDTHTPSEPDTPDGDTGNTGNTGDSGSTEPQEPAEPTPPEPIEPAA